MHSFDWVRKTIPRDYSKHLFDTYLKKQLCEKSTHWFGMKFDPQELYFSHQEYPLNTVDLPLLLRDILHSLQPAYKGTFQDILSMNIITEGHVHFDEEYDILCNLNPWQMFQGNSIRKYAFTIKDTKTEELVKKIEGYLGQYAQGVFLNEHNIHRCNINENGIVINSTIYPEKAVAHFTKNADFIRNTHPTLILTDLIESVSESSEQFHIEGHYPLFSYQQSYAKGITFDKETAVQFKAKKVVKIGYDDLLEFDCKIMQDNEIKNIQSGCYLLSYYPIQHMREEDENEW